jgi:hypothetical protein
VNFDEAEISCPWCGEPMAIPVDPSEGSDATFVEDCAVCCRPIVIAVHVDRDGATSVDVRREND